MNPNINTLNDSNNNQQSAQSALLIYATKAKETIIGLPLFVKVLPIILIIIYIFSIFFWHISFYLSNLPLYTIFQIQLWRFFTATLIMTGILNILFALVFWIPTSIGIEKTMGTLRYIFAFTINSLLIQVLYACVLLMLMPIFGDKILEIALNQGSNYVNCSGIWPILMMDITALCLQYPNNTLNLLCLPCKLKALFYPFILLLIFTLLNGFQIDIIVGVVYGVVYYYVLMNRMQLPDSWIAKCESSSAFKWIKSIKGYIELNSISKTEFGIGFQEQINEQQTHQQNSNINNQAERGGGGGGGGFNAFSGTGTVVG